MSSKWRRRIEKTKRDVRHQVNTVRAVKIIPRASTPSHSPNAPQALNSELLVEVPAVELHAHTVVPPSHLTHSRPREAEAGGLRTQGLENRGQDQSIKNLVSRTGSSVSRPPMCGLISRRV